MFNSEGRFPVTIKEAIIGECKFDEAKAYAGSFSVFLLLEVSDGSGQSDYWEGEYSSRMGFGTVADKMRKDLTIQTLTEVGLPNGDLSQLQALVGLQTSCTTKASTCGKYFNVRYIGNRGPARPEALDPAVIAQRIAQLNGTTAQGGGFAQQPSQQAPVQQQQPGARADSVRAARAAAAVRAAVVSGKTTTRNGCQLCNGTGEYRHSEPTSSKGLVINALGRMVSRKMPEGESETFRVTRLVCPCKRVNRVAVVKEHIMNQIANGVLNPAPLLAQQ
jgi:hypothetical protein